MFTRPGTIFSHGIFRLLRGGAAKVLAIPRSKVGDVLELMGFVKVLDDEKMWL